jgi:hypothetical protein
MTTTDTIRRGDGPYNVSSAVGSSWPWGHPGNDPAPFHSVDHADHVEPVTELDAYEVTVSEQPDWHGSVAVFAGTTETERLVFVVDQRPAYAIQYGLDIDGEVRVVVESWQVVGRRPLVEVVPTEHPATVALRDLYEEHQAIVARRNDAQEVVR